MAFLLIAAHSLSAQAQEPQKPAPPSPEVQQLKDRLQQLEATVDELKNQLKSLEDAKKTNNGATGEKVGSSANTTSPSTNPETAAKPSDEPKGESSFTVYGFAMLDAGYQFKQADPNWFDTVRPVKLPAFRDQFAPGGNFFSSVRQSRLGVKSSTPTKYGELKTTFEFELFGTGADAGQTTFRLRHAYGELGFVGAGQTWSTFVDPDVFPNTNEYWGPNGIPWFRNVQVRFMPLKGKNSVTIALERPGASADLGKAADRIELTGVKPRFPLPDLTANVRFDRDWGHFQASGVVREIKWVDTVNDAFDLGGSAVGAGLSLNTGLNFGKKDVGKFSFTYGQGIQNYMNDAPVDVGIALTHSTNPRIPIKGVALPMWAVMAYLDHTWNKRFSSSIGYSMLDISNSDGQTPDAFRRGHYASGNLLFYPVDNAMVGAELIWGRRENFLDGFKSDDVHLQFSFKYNFKKEFKF
ncbi:MAG TPA: DcaP family trimeric outer membrane transporter [Pyrinomonadaceae bacterium]|nr:DcaP family trimeric outer membrane transporter [Pyrinomonadaceae bacterium]